MNLLQQSDSDEEQARQILLEQSDASENDDADIILLRPSIPIKRISQADAERFIPQTWKKESDHSEASNSSSISSSSDEEEDYQIKYRTQKSPSDNKTEKSSISSHKQTDRSHKKTKEVFINYNPSTILDEPSMDDSITIAQDISPTDEDRLLMDVIENNDNESIFASLDIAQDKPNETHPVEESEGPSNEQVSTTQDSTDDQ